MKYSFGWLLANCCLALFFLFVFVKPIFADEYSDCVKSNTPAECSAIIGLYDQRSYKKVFSPSYYDQLQNNKEVLIGKLNSAGWIATVVGPIPPTVAALALGSKEVVTLPDGTQTTRLRGGAVDFFASSMEFMVNTKPASSMEYVAYMGNRLHVPGTPDVAYAADGGFGFNGLTPVLNIWTVSRNLAYFLFAIVFIVVGVMIMTRRKIDPKTAATIQNALPKIIFALIIVTFSYAIAGFMVDIMYVSLGLIVTFMNAVVGGSPVDVSQLLSGSIFGFVFNGFFSTTIELGQTVSGIINSIIPDAGGPGSLSINNAVGAVNPLAIMGGGLAILIVSIAILVALFRTWFALLGAFANVVLAVIFAPLRLTLDAVPGQNQFGGWIKDLLANLLTFPLVTILLAIGAYIASYPNPQDVKGFTPPLLGAGTVSEVLPFVGLGILLTIPKALDIMRETLKAPAFKFGGAWMESMRASTGISWAGAKYAPNAPGVQRYVVGPLERNKLITGVRAQYNKMFNTPGADLADSAEADERRTGTT